MYILTALLLTWLHLVTCLSFSLPPWMAAQTNTMWYSWQLLKICCTQVMLECSNHKRCMKKHYCPESEILPVTFNFTTQRHLFWLVSVLITLAIANVTLSKHYIARLSFMQRLEAVNLQCLCWLAVCVTGKRQPEGEEGVMFSLCVICKTSN